jgi:hypothetical protein
MRFVEFVTQAGHPAPGDQRSVTLHTPRTAFSGFHLLGDFIDVGVQRLQKLPRLCCVGVIDHVGIIAPTSAWRAPWRIQQMTSSPARCSPSRRRAREHCNLARATAAQ